MSTTDNPSNGSTDSSTTLTFPNISSQIEHKMDGTNYLQWLAQIVKLFRSFGASNLWGLLMVQIPPHLKLFKMPLRIQLIKFGYRRDQHLLSSILASLTVNVVSTVYGHDTSKQVWTALASRYSVQSRSRLAHLRRQLQTISQGSRSCNDFIDNVKSIADQLAAADKRVDEQDLISYILAGLNPSYNSFVTSFNLASRDKEFTLDDFVAELLGCESILEAQNSSPALHDTHYAMVATKGNVPTSKSKSFLSKGNTFAQQRRSIPYNSSGRPSHSSISPQQKNGVSSPPNKEKCQICDKTSHKALDCYHIFDFSYQGRHPPSQLAAMVADRNAQYDNQVWFADSAANAHITSNVENFSNQQPYNGDESVTIGNGSGLHIKNTASTSIQLGKSKFYLTNVLHCPSASSNLISINKFFIDNDCYFLLTGDDFLVKENHTGKVLFHEIVENGLYPFALNKTSLNKLQRHTSTVGLKAPLARWHSRLGHPSSPVLQSLIRLHSLPVTNSANKVDLLLVNLAKRNNCHSILQFVTQQNLLNLIIPMFGLPLLT